MNELETLPKDMEIPWRPAANRSRPIGNKIHISKADFDYMQSRNFKGRFAIRNRRIGHELTLSTRLAVALGNKAKQSVIVLNVANKPMTTTGVDGVTWRTVRLISAYKSEDGKVCVIEIAPIEPSKPNENTQED